MVYLILCSIRHNEVLLLSPFEKMKHRGTSDLPKATEKAGAKIYEDLSPGSRALDPQHRAKISVLLPLIFESVFWGWQWKESNVIPGIGSSFGFVLLNENVYFPL